MSSTYCGSNNFCRMEGMRSVPPASTRMLSACFARWPTASSTVCGRNSLNCGRLIESPPYCMNRVGSDVSSGRASKARRDCRALLDRAGEDTCPYVCVAGFSYLLRPPCQIEPMALRPFAPKPQRSPVFAKTRGRRRIRTFGQVHELRVLLRAQCRQDTLRREGTLVQPNANRVINGVRDCGNGRCQRAFAALLGAERAFGIDALDDDGFDFRRLYRGRAAVFEQSRIHQHAI